VPYGLKEITMVLLGYAGMNHDGGISTGGEALGVPRALGYEASN
jgi:hypothetical protein